MGEQEKQLRICHIIISWAIRRLDNLHCDGCRNAKKLLEQSLKELEKEIPPLNLGDVPNPMWKEEE